eukprot:CAMPEP_0197594102 /NCGR_PEP_ID=MMETSP1326-20131121/19725_1 /TAXON_ID=1155430 /ORGANISM="Genus nov. species nov., Strain RCC2288" /LENGTH=349 /DNA_ID=CAMNT_0043160207 /DNA_START=579 /DNA_END=1624 /DNA_ORIENTATION=-
MAAPLTVMQQAAKSYFYVVIWMSISMAVILFNKYILAYSGFGYPIALTLWHMVFCTTVATLAVRVLGVTKRLHMPQKEYINRVIPIGALYAASLWLSNSAYLHLSVSFIQMTKALMPGLVYMCGVFFAMEKLSTTTSVNMLIIAFGVAIAAYGEINFVWLGVAEQLSALVFEAMRLMLVQVLITRQGYSMNPIQSLYYVSPACAACLALPFVAVELPAILANTALVINYPMLLLNAVTAFALNLAVFLLIGKTSALTMNIAGVIKDWMLIFASQHLFGNSVSFLNYLGYVIAFLSVGMYNYNKMKQMKQKEQSSSKDRESGKAQLLGEEGGGGGDSKDGPGGQGAPGGA